MTDLNRTMLAQVFGADVLSDRPSLFSARQVTVSAAEMAAMRGFVEAMETVVAAPTYQQAVGVVEADFPASAAHTAGVCMGYDFHFTPCGPKLIEINTNAGGLALLAELMKAWGMDGNVVLEDTWAMFAEEWAEASRFLRQPRPLQRIAIVDEGPATQYLAPEFTRYAALFAAQGVDAMVLDPADLTWDEAAGCLTAQGGRIDLVYNRLTDFSLTDPRLLALRAAWLADAFVLTPHPRAHRLYADKRNLVTLADAGLRSRFGLPAAVDAALAVCLLPIREVRAEEAEMLWAERKQLFFKPAAGFGSRATYRGDKMTKRVFDEVLQGGYVAQALALPPELPAGPDSDGALKYDLRLYAYRGRVLAAAARLYQGQTTNFRTLGGGFAPVLVA